MRWKLALVGTLIVVGAIGAGIRHALQPPLALFIVPGATDIQVVEREPGLRLITYQAPGQRCDWYATVTRTLAAHHWQAWWSGADGTSVPEQAPGTRADPPRISYTHIIAFRLGYLWDQAVLDPDPRAAWPLARAPVHCRPSHAHPAPDRQSAPQVARIMVRRTILPSYWLVDRMQKLFEWMQK